MKVSNPSRRLVWLIAAALAIAVPAAATARPSDDAMAPTDKQLNALYWQGHESLKNADWTAALKRFQDLEKQLRAKEPASADAAVYWQAYALAQANRDKEAKAVVQRLHREFPQSRWADNADEIVRGKTPVSTDSIAVGDEDLVEIAVEGLMSAEPERALPLLQRVLKSKHSTKVKKRALFVLSQMDDAAALAAVGEIARGNGDKELREEAIRMLGISGEDKAMAELTKLYGSSNDADVRRAVLQAYLVADRKDLVLEVARGESSPALRREAVQTLGAMDGVAELKQLFEASRDEETQRDIVQALGVANETAALAKIAGGNYPETLRIEAMHALGVAGEDGTSSSLRELYPKLDTPALREAALEGMLIAGDEEGMVALYRTARTKEEKQALLRKLTALDGDTALEVIEATLKEKE